MTKKKSGDYEVGYGKPPKGGQFPPGVSGNKGRRKRLETQAEIIARTRDDRVEINGKLITKFELVWLQVMNQTIKSGKPRDFKILMEIMEKYGALPKADQWEDARGAADKVIEKMRNNFLATKNIDPADFEEHCRHNREEAQLVMSCPHCGPALKEGWTKKIYKDLAKRVGKSNLHEEAEGLHMKDDRKK
jgi:hypothetical protein